MQLKFQKKVRDYLFERLKTIEMLLTETELSCLTQLVPDGDRFTDEQAASVREFFRCLLSCDMVMIQSILWNQHDDESIQNAMDKFYLHFNV